MSLSVSASRAANSNASTRPKPLRTQLYKLARWLHVYMSTATLLVILFFSISGILLNHPDFWNHQPLTQEVSGTLAAGWWQEGQIDWLGVTESMRLQHGVYGQVSDYWSDDGLAQASFAAPGYLADLSIDLPSGTYILYTESQGALAFIKDLHKGNHTGPSWNWLIDVSAIFLALVSLSGLALTLFLKKLRLKGLLTILAGTVTAFALLFLAL